MSKLTDFNSGAPGDAAALVRPCLDVDRWVEEVVAGRPYADHEALFDRARSAAQPFTADEMEGALAHHPRIGEAPTDPSTEADLSRGEQATLDLDADVQARLAEGNRRYEERFERVFLIRAAGRTSRQILEQLESRLGHDDETEARVTAEQLREIALLRLAGAIA